MEGNNSRRRFLQTLAGTAAIVGLNPRQTEAAPVRQGRALVVVVTCKRALQSGYDADPGAMRAMIEAGLCRLSGRKDVVAALSTYVRPGDRVGYKINGLAHRQAATHVELVDALSAVAKRAGIEPRHQVAFDRLTSDLTGSWFGRAGQGAYQCLGNDDGGHEEEIEQMPSSASRLATTLTRRVDVMVNLPILKQHMLAGMTGALKNNFGCIHNPHKMHLTGCDPYVAEVNAIPVIRAKQKLIVMDALRPVVHGGPSYVPAAAIPARKILFATDPVAIDTVALEILEDLRTKEGLSPLAKVDLQPRYLATAAKMGLGVGDRSRIDVVSMEV